jgi:hypothetical protein
LKNTNKEEVFIMPGFDGTGPQGQGPMTGGARGFCNPYSAYRPVYGGGYGMGRGFRGGFGGGFGRGRGYGRGFGWRGAYQPYGAWYGPANAYGTPYTMKPEDELNILKNEASAIKNDLDEINRRIQEIETQSQKS